VATIEIEKLARENEYFRREAATADEGRGRRGGGSLMAEGH
jgi:hypothetical protein